jgi:hypothetical protein
VNVLVMLCGYDAARCRAYEWEAPPPRFNLRKEHRMAFCVHCGTTFEARSARDRFCSDACDRARSGRR